MVGLALSTVRSPITPFPTVVASSVSNSGISCGVPLNFLRNGVKYPVSVSSFSWPVRKDAVKLVPRASVGSVGSVTEPATKVNFPKEVTVPGCSSSLVLLGTGYREKVFAIIGVKVYAAGFFIDPSAKEHLSPFKENSEKEASSIFNSIYEAPCEKSLNIKLVRNVDGKTFWDALNDVITPRVEKLTSTDEAALSVFRTTFMDRSLKEGTSIFLTWAEPSKLLISISADGLPSSVDATIESSNVNSALFDGFFGNSPVSPSLKASVISGIDTILN